MNAVSMAGAILTLLALVLLPGRAEAASQDIPYGVASWPSDGLGNHRAVVSVAKTADAVRVTIPWRRRAQDPAPTGIVVVDAATGKRVKNVAVRVATVEEGEIAFQPDTAPGDYYVYYMPYRHKGPHHQFRTEYLPFEQTADPAWADSLTDAWDKLPVAKVAAIQARTEFDWFDPMEVCATKAETEALVAAHPDAPYLVFPEDREHAIRMPDAVPLRWAQHGPADTLTGAAMRGEYYAFQVGLFAAKADLGPIRVTFGDLTGPGGTILASEFTCFNTGGIDWLGRPFDKACTVPKGRIQALWCGVPILEALAAGRYAGRVTVQPEGAPATTVSLTIDIAEDIIAEHGDNEQGRLSRLRWLNSTLGLDDDIIPPYTPLAVDGSRVGCLLRDVTFGPDGLPASIRANDTEILANPMRFVVESADGVVDWKELDAAVVTKETPGKVEWVATRTAGALTIRCRALMEFDGYINYFVELTASEPLQLTDARLEIPIRRDVASYMMGMGRKGGYRPESWEWDWADRRANNSLWLGDVQAGLHCKLKDPEDRWNLYHLGDDSVPESWENSGNGGCTLSESGDDVVIRAFSGARAMAAGETQLFRFGLLPTPVKRLDNAHWSQRYYHAYVPVKQAKDAGATIVNIHHANELNPNINYPFIEVDRLGAYIREAHDADLKVKIYYTVRELSNRVAELWALRSLGHEIYTPGAGGGYSWLHEHLVSDYAPAWHEPRLPNGEVDGSIATTGLSRWHNYYIEGLGWLLRHMEIDGLYLDGIGYNRDIMQRVRKVMDRTRPGSLIDFHSGNNFHPNYGLSNCANQYMELFPYVNSLWFGEGYDYNESPDYWMVEISGIPFGLYGEMLQGGGNPWRGMVYGMSNRFYHDTNPSAIWGLWDQFGIAESRMHGYWESECPVRTGHNDVLATAYVADGRTLIALASWADKPVQCTLDVDWAALGLDPTKAALYAPPLDGIQPGALFKPDAAINVMPGRGWLLICDEEERELPAQANAYDDAALVLEEQFHGATLDAAWTAHQSTHPGTALRTGDGLAIDTAANCTAFVSRDLPDGVTMVECRIRLGSDGGATWGPGFAVTWPGHVLRVNLRAENRFGVDVDGGQQHFAGYVDPPQWYRVRVRCEGAAIHAEASMDGIVWETLHMLANAAPNDGFDAVIAGKMHPSGRNEDHTETGPMGTCTIGSVQAYETK
ncbi:MAG: hypothetical protein GY851_16750 [bacterium]|nr:hypothetical protein [bacterium]